MLAFTLPEAIWLATPTERYPAIDDVVVGYPTVDRATLLQLCADPNLRQRITLMVDDDAHLTMIQEAARSTGARVRICIDVDSSWRPRPPGTRKPLHIGAQRSPLHSREDVIAFASRAVRSKHLQLVGLMFYEAQIAGVGNRPPGHAFRARAISAMQSASARELSTRRPQIVASVNEVLRSEADSRLEFVNAGGTGSLELSSADPSVTEVTAGSGFFAPTLFDSYRHFEPIPAAAFALPVVRRPNADTVTVLGADTSHQASPTPQDCPPRGCRQDSNSTVKEGAGEVQTPLHGDAAAELAIGDRVVSTCQGGRARRAIQRICTHPRQRDR